MIITEIKITAKSTVTTGLDKNINYLYSVCFWFSLTSTRIQLFTPAHDVILVVSVVWQFLRVVQSTQKLVAVCKCVSVSCYSLEFTVIGVTKNFAMFFSRFNTSASCKCGDV